MKKRIVVVCPGRGSYTKETLGYLKKYQRDYSNFIEALDEARRINHEPTLTELDQESQFKPQLHTKGENASALIYACSYCDYLSLDQSNYEIVAVTGNSMGWYIAEAVAGALSELNAFRVINTMGSMMKNEIIGGQVIYPIVDENWIVQKDKEHLVFRQINEANQISGAKAFLSIRLGGYLVIGGNQIALDFLLKNLPKKDNYPFQLINHAAFHTPLLEQTSREALSVLPVSLFESPKVPLIDGRGHIWKPYATDVEELHQYTLGHQVTEVYDFSKAIEVSLKEFSPDHLILLGPGNSLGGAIGQILIQHNWNYLNSKSAFSQAQDRSPFLISLGLLRS